MTLSTSTARETKYCNAIKLAVARMGHATNADIAAELRKTYPTLSDTTVHRATARLASRGELAVAPADNNGAMRYDNNLQEHDHFMCNHCGQLRDVDIASDVVPLLENKLGSCHISGRIIISGACQSCSGS